MEYLPIFMNLKHSDCLVVGGGGIAARKVALLIKAGADVTVVSPGLAPELVRLKQEQAYAHHERGFEDEDVEARTLIIAATDDRQLNEHISTMAADRNIPVNVVDNTELCSFIMPSIIDRSPVQIAVSTGGASPVLARMIRTRLEGLIPASFGRLGRLVSDFRSKVKETFDTVEQRRGFWETVLNGPIAEMVFSGRDEEADAALEQLLHQRSDAPVHVGEVYLVGAGPGDPDLLTFRALRLMQQADVVVYDRLVSPAIMDKVRRDAEIIYVGKKRSDHVMAQEHINQLLVDLAKQGKRVLRLKGGDPFIFGRGGEEIELLAANDVPFQIVPGITAASGCACYAGIPLTHRDHAQSCVFVTGHLKDGTVDLNWDMLTHPNQTLVIYMGLHGAQTICEQLVTHGLSPETPVALVEQGTTPQQRVFVATLDTLVGAVSEQGIQPPTLIIVGDVVRLHDKLQWLGEHHIDLGHSLFSSENR